MLFLTTTKQILLPLEINYQFNLIWINQEATAKTKCSFLDN